MRRTLLAIVFLAATVSFAHAQDKIRILIVDGQNNHNYKAMTPFMKEQLEKSGLFSVDVSTTPPAAPTAPRPGKEETAEQKEAREKQTAEIKERWGKWRPTFKDYKVVLSNYNGERWPADVNSAFEEYVRGGGGFLVVHAANNAFAGWHEYDEMIGLGWRGKEYGARLYYDDAGTLQRQEAKDGPGAGHGPQHEFVITIRDTEHPITRGMPKTWLHATDELYQGQRGPAEKMQILATAFSDRSKGGTGVHEPMLWVIPYGQGRVVTNVMGHENGKAVQCVGFVTILLRSCEWLATGKVSIPIPENFPSAEKSCVVGGK